MDTQIVKIENGKKFNRFGEREEQKRYKEKHPGRAHTSFLKWKEKNPGAYRKMHTDYNNKYKQQHPDKYRAHRALEYAIRLGRIAKPKLCESCREKKRLEGHHNDYSKPLKVKWLCRHCHNETHKAAQRTK